MATAAESPQTEPPVVNHDLGDAQKQPNSQKRRASPSPSPDNASAKRLRIEEDDTSVPESKVTKPVQSPTELKPRDANQGSDGTRRAGLSKDEEKKRGKRLFGGLLSTLSQTTTSSQQKKRQEIERRQHEKVQKQKAEDDKKRAEKLAKITGVRRHEQIKFEEKVMKTRHSNMLAMARSFQTKAEPRIYYRPWKLTKEQEETIDDQIQDAKTIIEREVEEFNLRKDPNARDSGRSRPSTSRSDEMVLQGADSSDAVPHIPLESANSSTSQGQKDGHDKEQHDESGDVVMEAEEDTVIY